MYRDNVKFQAVKDVSSAVMENVPLHGTGRNWGICVVVTMTTCEFVIYSGKALRGLSS